ncbi:MAG: NTPase [Thermoplasmata archaeon]|nr:NTPase [Thermoplasmata archaeon]
MKVFVTGNPGCGKTTLIKKIVGEIKRPFSGFLTEEIRTGKGRTGFKMIDLVTGQEGILANVDLKGGPKVSRYTVSVEDIERIAVPSLERDAELYIIDEIGKMEMFSNRFKTCLNELLSSEKDVIATLGKYFVKDYEDLGEIIWLSRDKFDDVYEKLTGLVAGK